MPYNFKKTYSPLVLVARCFANIGQDIGALLLAQMHFIKTDSIYIIAPPLTFILHQHLCYTQHFATIRVAFRYLYLARIFFLDKPFLIMDRSKHFARVYLARVYSGLLTEYINCTFYSRI